MQIFRQTIESLGFFKELTKSLRVGETPCSLTGVSNIHKAHTIFGLSETDKVLVICDDEQTARRLANDINEFTEDERACVFPAKDFTFGRIESVSREYEHQRIEALSKISTSKCKVLVAGVEAVMQYTIPPEVLYNRTIRLKNGDEKSLLKLSQELVVAGYVKSSQIEGAGQFAVRGAIIDIFPVQEQLPVRIEFWGDEIDSISSFDVITQRRTENIDEIAISPSLEIIPQSNEILASRIEQLIKSARGKKKDEIKENLTRDLELVKSGVSLSNIDKYISLCYDDLSTVFDYFDDSPVVICEYANVVERSKGFWGQHQEDLKILFEDGTLFKSVDKFCLELSEVFLLVDKMKAVYLDTFMRGGNNLRFKKLIVANAMQSSPWGGDLSSLIDELKAFVERGFCTVLMAGSDKTLDILLSDLSNENIPVEILKEDSQIKYGIVYLTPGSISSGYEYPDGKIALITQVKAIRSKRKVKKKKKGEQIKSLSDITSGDLVVHSLYGIGKFSGISKIATSGVTRDYITIKYAGSDVLYVPVTQLDLVSKFIGPREDSGVKLNKLSSTDWQKTKSRVKSAIRDMADELLMLYAKRQATVGFAFSKDNDWQNDFDGRFPYQETDDQLRSIDEIKSDMEKASPMDRLLCGDVGFGKTEVALRAAFKCVLDSKQCAILVPTTVLAWQHYQTAIRRFEHFPIKVELLSRFRTPKQQKDILKSLERGEIDIIIGTHRLVQKDVKFKDIGLAIIDEEQRFGVAHKEKFKEMFVGIDVLTLSATPIPRTLNMAMSGIRDMSVIDEPPQDRFAVQTYVIEFNMGVIIQAIMKEMRRGGQVYYIHNRIDDIENCVLKIQNALPDARIGIAHGRISENELSEVWRQLVDHEIDILVCTTLIETGVDVANCNTLIIEDADRMGLSQLYQLRGRVGRSNRRAFAYFTFRRGKVLTEIATKRLEAIKEFTQFGSGFRIALRDLEIRGAGSILSGRQHGHMEAVGYDMYIRLLSEAIAEQKGEKPPHNPEDCLVDIALDAYIPDEYIENLAQRIEAYRLIANIQNKEDSMDVLDELIDRYGEPTPSVIGLIDVALMRNTASRLSISEISQRGDSMLFYIKTAQVGQIQALNAVFKKRVLVQGSGKSYISVKMLPHEKAIEVMKLVLSTLSESNNMDENTNYENL